MYIVITQPFFFEGEAERITLMFQSGLQRLHLRKPGSTIEDCRALLHAIPAVYHPRIVLHDHFELLDEFCLCGVHINSRNAVTPTFSGYPISVSTSCHSIEELREKKHLQFDYLSLSPIFNSISKQGYNAAFTREELLSAKAQGIIDERVMALGGICQDNMTEALSYGFGGAMVLGDAWQKQQLPVVLSIAGSDPSAGAGIQQDLKTITNCSCYGATVITAITSQNTIGVQGVMPVSPQVVESQLRSIFSDIRVDAVKIGMVPDIEVARVIINTLKEERQKRLFPIVCDPIMLSTSGTRLMSEDCIELIAKELFPLCTLVTPNLPENEYLKSHGYSIAANLLLKGGHANSAEMTDTLYIIEEGKNVEYRLPKINTKNLHGTGCTLSSAIASEMAKGHSLEHAVSIAKHYIHRAIQGGKDLRIGHGNGPLWCDSAFVK